MPFRPAMWSRTCWLWRWTSKMCIRDRSMVSDTGAYDVLLMNLSYMPVERLIEQGYCADLSQSADIRETVSYTHLDVYKRQCRVYP